MLFLRFLVPVLSAAALLLTAAHANPPATQTAPANAPAAQAAPDVKPTPDVKFAPAKAQDDEDKVYPAQATVAAKAAFGTVEASDKSVTAALDAKALTEAAKLVGKMGSFQGVVTQVYSPRNHGFVALDFAPHYKDALTADALPADYAKFPDLTQLAGKHVLVSGKFVAKGGQTQLSLTSPDQIKIVP